MGWIQVVLKLIEDPTTAVTIIQGVQAIVASVESIIKTVESLTQSPQVAPVMTAIANRLNAPPKA